MSDESQPVDNSEVVEIDENENHENQDGQESSSGEVVVQAADPESFKDEVQDAIEAGASEADVKKMIKEFQLKVNGKTISKKIDLSNDDDLKRELQFAAAGRQSMQELAELRRQYEQDLARLKKDPWSVLQELEIDPDEMAEKRLQERINELKKSPEQLEREKMSRELDEARKKEADTRRRLEEIEMQRLESQANAEIQEEIDDALSAYTKLPNVPRVRQKIADAMLWAMDNGYEDVGVADVLPSVEEELRSEFNNLFDQLPEETMEHWIGKKNSERLRQKRVAAAKKAATAAPKVKETTASQRHQYDASKPKSKVNAKDFFKNLGR